MKEIGIVGAQGFFGKSLSKSVKKLDFDFLEITSQNFSKVRSEEFKFLINTATPSRKYWALNNPYSDFKKTVELTADLVYNWKYEKFIQISTMSVNEIPSHHPYSINKKAAEIISSYPKSLIVRLGALFGEGLDKGPLFDLLTTKKVYVDIKSEYNYINTEFAAEWILNNLDREGIVQLGARDTISLYDISKELNLKAKFEGKKERIFSSEIEPGMPCAKEVWNFINQFTN